MAKKTKVFVAHSFEKKAPPGETMSDVDVANWFVSLMRKSPLGYTVAAGSKPSPRSIDEKIKRQIADCSCVVGIFTKRHFDGNSKKWLPPQFVLCECACALGFYYNTNKLICGFHEEGIKPEDLALITIGGLELIGFERSRLERDKSRFIEYLKQIPKNLKSGGEALLFKSRPYRQLKLRKIYTIYRNGNMHVHNMNKILVTDDDRFAGENRNRITHEIWHKRATIPVVKEMVDTAIDQRREKAFLRGILTRINQKKMDTPLSISVRRAEKKQVFIDVGFVGRDGNPARMKNQDTLEYQYAWGIPGAYARAEDLEGTGSGLEINEKAYNQAEVVANHGLVKELTLELRFERGRGDIFSKSPFYQTSYMRDLPDWSDALPVPMSEEEDHEMWYQTYRLDERDFEGRIRVLWRPASVDND